MQYYDRNTLIDRMITAIRAESSEITYFGPGPTRAILSAVAAEIQHLYYSLFQTEQANSLLTAADSALDSQAAERGLTRRSATSASAVLTIEANSTGTGTGTISTSGTTVNGVGTLFLSQVAVGDTLIVGGTSAVVTAVSGDNDGPLTVGSSMGTLTNAAFQIRKASVTISASSGPLQVASTAGVVFEVPTDVTLVPTYTGSSVLRGSAVAVSVGTGSAYNLPAYAIRRVVNPQIVPVVTVTATNEAPAQGGSESETDAQLRARVINIASSLNQGTPAFYEAQARQVNSRVIRVYLARGASLNEVLVYCLTSDGATLSANEKTTLTSALSSLSPVQTSITIRDMNLQAINIEFSTSLLSGYTLSDVRDELVESYRQFLNWSTWQFGQPVQADDLLRIASNTTGLDRIDVSTFFPQADTPMTAATLPRVGQVTIRNIATGQNLVVNGITSQYPRLT